MKLGIYLEHHPKSGELCTNQAMLRKHSGDFLLFEGNSERMRESAELLRNYPRTQWARQAAETVLNHLDSTDDDSPAVDRILSGRDLCYSETDHPFECAGEVLR